MVARLDHKGHTNRDHGVESKQDNDVNIGVGAKVSVKPIETTSYKMKEIHHEQQDKKQECNSSECEHLYLAKEDQ